MPATDYKHERLGKFSLHNIAADACRYIETDGQHAELDCPRCTQTLRTRHTGDHVHHEGGPLHNVLLDHLFHDCPAVTVAR